MDVRALKQPCAREDVCGRGLSSEGRAVPKAKHARIHLKCNVEGMGWEGESVDRLRTGRRPRLWHSRGPEAMALEAGVLVETVTKGTRRFMAAWKKEEEDVARHRQKKRGKRDNESCYRRGKRRTCLATSTDLVDESKGSCTGTRRAETCLAPRYHVDALYGASPTIYYYSCSCGTRLVLSFVAFFPRYQQPAAWATV